MYAKSPKTLSNSIWAPHKASVPLDRHVGGAFCLFRCCTQLQERLYHGTYLLLTWARSCKVSCRYELRITDLHKHVDWKDTLSIMHEYWILQVLSVGQAVHFSSKIEFKCDKNSRSSACLTSRYSKLHFGWSWYTVSLVAVMYEKSDVPSVHQSIDSDLLKSF